MVFWDVIEGFGTRRMCYEGESERCDAGKVVGGAREGGVCGEDCSGVGVGGKRWREENVINMSAVRSSRWKGVSWMSRGDGREKVVGGDWVWERRL